MKLTIIYSEWYSNVSITEKKTVIEVKKPELQNIQDELAKQNINFKQVDFIFKGEHESIKQEVNQSVKHKNNIS